jgi:hypothetical protein
MPFANKFRAMMDFPFVGDTIGAFVVEAVEVGHEGQGSGSYVYPVRMTLRGPGGQQGVRRALKALFASHPTTFSGYGNPYQLWFGRPEVESLGDKRYAVWVEGAGSRIFLEQDLYRFLDYLEAEGLLGDGVARERVVEAYLERYRAEIKRKVDRYRRKLARS